MSTPHIIRLRPPWDCQGQANGQLRAERTFHCPTNLEPTDTVDLVVERVIGRGRVALNAESLGEIPSDGSTWRREITRMLRPRNRLTIVVEVEGPWRGGGEGPSNPRLIGGLIGEVRLEILTAD